MSETAEALQERIASTVAPETDVPENDTGELSQTDTQEQSVQETVEESGGQEETSTAFEEVEYEGRKYQVPPELKDALMAKSDYTTKTTETARLRDTLTLQQKEVALHQESRAFEQTVAEDFDRLKMLDAYIQHQKTNTDWGAMNTDALVRSRLELDQLGEQRNELLNVLKGKQAEFNAKLQSERSNIKQEADAVLSKVIPNYTPQVKADIEKFVMGLGYPEMATQNMTSLDYQVAWEASQFRKLKQGTAAAVKTAANAPPVIRPGASNPVTTDARNKTQFQKDMDKARKSNAPEAQKARIIQNRLEQKLGRI